jgi:preprotein translocase subunit SecA
MFKFITHPLLRSLVEWRIKAALLRNHDDKIHLKQWLAVAHEGKFTEEAWQYQFSNPVPFKKRFREKIRQLVEKIAHWTTNREIKTQLISQPGSITEETIADLLAQHAVQDMGLGSGPITSGPSLVQFMLDKAAALSETATTLTHHQLSKKLNARFQFYYHQSQTYYKELFQTWRAKKESSKTNPPRTDISLRWYHHFLAWCIKKSGFKWQFESKDLLNDELFFEKVRKFEKVSQDDESTPKELEANRQTTDKNLFSPERLPETHTVGALLNGSEWMQRLLLRRLKKEALPNHSETKKMSDVSPHPIPAQLQNWIKGSKLTFTQSIDQSQVYQAQKATDQAQHHTTTLKRVQELQETLALQQQSQQSTSQEIPEYVDCSPVLGHSYVFYQAVRELPIPSTKQYWQTVQWLERLRWSISKELSCNLHITQAAQDALIKAKGHIGEDEFFANPDALPLGFSLKLNENGSYTLQYNEAKALHELTHHPRAALKPNANKKSSYFILSKQMLVCSTTKDELLETLTQRRIQLNSKQIAFLERLDNEENAWKFTIDDSIYDDSYSDDTNSNDTKLEKIRIQIKSFAFRALQRMAEAIYPLPEERNSQNQKQQDPYLGEFIDILDSFSKVDEKKMLSEGMLYHLQAFSFLDDDKSHTRSHYSYLHFFILCYLKHIEGKEFYGETERAALKRFQKIVTQDRNQYEWLRAVECSTTKRRSWDNYASNADFSAISQGLFCFFDCFEKTLGRPLPPLKKLCIEIYDLEYMLDCIELAGQGKDQEMKSLQADFMFSLPFNRFAGMQALKSGYAFVIQEMFMTHHHHGISVLTPERFEVMTYDNVKIVNEHHSKADHLKEFYLSFISQHVKPRYIRGALKEWERITGNAVDQYNSNKQEIHQNIQNQWEYLKHYALSLPRVMSNIQKPADAPEAYPLPHLQSLLTKLHLEPGVEAALRVSIERVDALTREYAALSGEEMEHALRGARGLKGEDALERRLALLREAHYRMTFSEEQGRGEWMRLEQLVSILLGIRMDRLLQIDTSEGKTFILQMIALLKHLEGGRKVNVLTHEAKLAEEAGDSIARMGRYLGVKTARKGDSVESILDADIYYTDISDAVIQDLLAEQREEASTSEGKPLSPLPGNRKAEIAILDEVDAIFDIHAMTTMQIAKATEDADRSLEAFLMALNEVVREELTLRTDLLTEEAQRQSIREALDEQLRENPFYQERARQAEELDAFIRAAISAMALQKEEDYIVQKDEGKSHRQVVRIVHKETTGRVDKLSQWGNHVHQCVAAWEKRKDPEVAIPGITQILKVGDIASYLEERYTERMGVSGTLGEDEVREEIELMLKLNQSTVMPRAKRTLDHTANWPLKGIPETKEPHLSHEVNPDTEGKEKPKASKKVPVEEIPHRIYSFPPIITPSEEAQFEALLDAIQNIKAAKQSAILFFDTIQECNAFASYLEERKIYFVQILDDTQDEENEESATTEQAAEEKTNTKRKGFRPPESILRREANLPGKITLTTAVGGRGIDFNGVDVGIITKPGLSRTLIQEAGRIGRNGMLGLLYAIYNEKDFGYTVEEALKKEPQPEAQTTPSPAPRSRWFSFHVSFKKKPDPTPPQPTYEPINHHFFAKPYSKEAEHNMRERVKEKRVNNQH